MPISWNEIRQNAIAFSKDWADETSEKAEAKTFWDEFFKVFGIKRRVVASFESPVRKLSGEWGWIDLFWKGTLLAEHKSRGKPLDKAHAQAMDYIQGLKNENRDKEIPRYIVESDFARVALHDLEEGTTAEFPLTELHKNVHHFAFIPGYKQHVFADQDPINIEAVERLGNLHDELEAGGFSGHDLERFLVRVLFCLFAEDTGLFERNAFTLFIENHSAEDGSDLGPKLDQLFRVLNQPEDKRQANLLEELTDLPYVNGDLFAERLEFASFNRRMRDQLLTCCRFDWSQISPAIFGSLFQSVMVPKERRQVGAHYTSERDILKLVRSLFLDELKAEFARLAASRGTQRDARLTDFHRRLGELKFLDPACGCGNFLVITYRELRLLEIDVLKALHGEQKVTDIQFLSLVDVDAFYGIEIGEFPAQIAQVAMWLIDHQMNQKLSEAFGQYFARLPLKKSATIRHANALRTDWNDVLPATRCSYVLGNPPFVGKHLMTDEQGGDIELVWGNAARSGVLDYVSAWYRKACVYISCNRIPAAFVSTNSITQGEQVGVLWTTLFREFGLKIHFAHRTFSWESEARGKAHVHVVIIGFSTFDVPTKLLFEHSDDSQVTATSVKNISPYLIEGSDTAVESRRAPLASVPACMYGSKPTDGGNLIVEEADREAFLLANPASGKYLRPLLCAEECLHSIPRWCLWLLDANPSDIRQNLPIMERIELVKRFRESSKKEATKQKANQPSLFAEIRQPSSRFMVIPQHTSQLRKYVPFGYFEPKAILHNSCSAIPDATLYHFGVLSSATHMSWVKTVCGRIKSDIRYSTNLVYNNFPWPEA